MSVEELVDASLAGFDQGELITIPSLPDVGDWETLNAARKALAPTQPLAPASRRALQDGALQRLDSDRNRKVVRAAAEYHAAQGRDVAEVSPCRDGDVIGADVHVVGGIELEPAKRGL